jgi:hypothetical protein
MSAKRNYGDLLQRAKALVGAEYTYKILAEIAGYPIVSVRRVVRDDLPTALVTGERTATSLLESKRHWPF